jgi:hypothetical protein
MSWPPGTRSRPPWPLLPLLAAWGGRLGPHSRLTGARRVRGARSCGRPRSRPDGDRSPARSPRAVRHRARARLSSGESPGRHLQHRRRPPRRPGRAGPGRPSRAHRRRASAAAPLGGRNHALLPGVRRVSVVLATDSADARPQGRWPWPGAGRAPGGVGPPGLREARAQDGGPATGGQPGPRCRCPPVENGRVGRSGRRPRARPAVAPSGRPGGTDTEVVIPGADGAGPFHASSPAACRGR